MEARPSSVAPVYSIGRAHILDHPKQSDLSCQSHSPTCSFLKDPYDGIAFFPYNLQNWKECLYNSFLYLPHICPHFGLDSKIIVLILHMSPLRLSK